MSDHWASPAFKRLTAIAVAAFTAISFVIGITVSITAQDQEQTIMITGQVVNGTEGGDPPAELTVFALVIDEGAESIVDRVESVTESGGTFSLEVARLSAGQFYRVVVDDGVYTPYVDILPSDLDQEVSLTVYDRTTSLDEISVTTYSVVIPVIDASTGVLGALAAVNLINSGDEVYLADLTDPDLTGFNLLRFNLPVGYKELTVESDLPSGNVMEIGTGFAISNPVPPGEHSMVISYSAPFEGGKFEYPMRLPFGAESVSIMIPEGSGEIAGLGLARGETVTIGEGTYVRYDGSNYERRAELGVVISGLPRPDLGSQVVDFLDSTQFRVAIVVSVALALIAVVAYVVLIAQRHRPIARVSGPASGDTRSDSRSAIVEAIAELDEMRELGKIEENEYLTRRQRLMQQAVNVDADQQNA